MTNNEIIKCLECCTLGRCDECPYKKKYPDCQKTLKMTALDLCVRLQQEEIEKVHKLYNELAVIRCKDCKHYETGRDYQPYCNNVNGIDDAKPYDFCSYAQKRSDKNA